MNELTSEEVHRSLLRSVFPSILYNISREVTTPFSLDCFYISVKPKMNVKPSGVKPISPAKQTQKRKISESHPTVAAVKPLNPIASTEMKMFASENTALGSTPDVSKDSIPKRVDYNSSELYLENQVASTLQAEVANPSSSRAAVAKTRRLSSTGSGKIQSSVEDDFDKLIWEISGGKLEAEIDLDPGKDEDELLLELSEMIDS
ncbi:PREDICTED: zinc finger CCCH domain-containing protein 11A-like [Thamnophis sirtalis]|uniref:Zinc finger CCCH domain-containing protein 11A-like n=1 Tax=Thamnophis sirtalis TaxID=35019 RepID=A0A6I9XPQ2_9SAUR|nr:PREDICTED: zinc finger CCCH domain-containing protein 11A-like [Thamnophis sirtalis]